MAIYTENGLKIRLDPKRIERVLAPAQGEINIEDAYHDIEFWAGFPNAASSVAAISIAFLTQSWPKVLLGTILAYLTANLLQIFYYSRLLKVIFPQLLGRWFISVPISVVITYYLFRKGSISAGIIQLVLVAANLWKITDVLLLIFMPIRVMLKKLIGSRLGDIELAFINILNSKARKIGVELDWKAYKDNDT